ncbi:hypothetical protein [Tuwongella immobilis]|uniref:Uncharacterized protein n=1 Tax=Tuwongella immobilis TaxID=692036 RepID=A0A6C2YP19_9BACT|nr:hypothetical protein [Tuwongella immobilis]VIP03041.1 Uncharacterized protein OS=Planctomyces limnophilus (strain ATCC 43296 / DSM 3776 / IFAM 1008 / 290) GN=Plim_0645 PE=4 SV=1 [Tuwongella immobilis]VTS03211.1 Uncharacterized protein OS=Planctomyces limnophilus (strain ATCC 43296 / DSM 3776 / IFAM 1008 / 290) GN=Plim_0645 PE=4 SV=1 [Tuwongella immobilis]
MNWILRRFCRMGIPATLAVSLLLLPTALWACSFCAGNLKRLTTFRQEISTARLIVIGTLSNPQLSPGSDTGTTDFQIEQRLRPHPSIADRKQFTIPRYVPIDPKKPNRFLLFCDVRSDGIDPYRGVPVHTDGMAAYLVDASRLSATDLGSRIAFFVKHLRSNDPEIAQDAFLEIARIPDADLEAHAKQLSPEIIREALFDPKTPTERLGVYGYLLGLCGGPADAEQLRQRIEATDREQRETFGGLLTGYVMLRPEAGWKWIEQRFANASGGLSEKLALLGTVQFLQQRNPAASRETILRIYHKLLLDRDLCDLITEDLRRWKWWDCTDMILSRFGDATFAAPIVRNGILRYALTCDDATCRAFIAKHRAEYAEILADIQESLQFERDAENRSRSNAPMNSAKSPR